MTEQSMWNRELLKIQMRDSARYRTPDSLVPLRHSQKRQSTCLLYTSDAADERSSVDLGGRRIIKKKNNEENIYDVIR